MMSAGRVLLAGLLGFCAASFGQEAQTPEQRASEVVQWLAEGRYQKLFQASDEAMRQAMPPETWMTSVGPTARSWGKLVRFGTASVQKVQGYNVVVLPTQFEKAKIDFTVSLTK